MQSTYICITLLLLVCGVISHECDNESSLCGGELAGFMYLGADKNNCTYVHIKQPSGTVYPSASPFSGCSDKTGQSEGIARSAKSQALHSVFFMSGQGANIYRVAYGSGDAQVYAKLPGSYNWTVGMEFLEGVGLLLLTTTDLYIVRDNTTISAIPTAAAAATGERPLEHLLTLHTPLTADAIMTSNYYTPKLFVADLSNLITVDCTALKETATATAVPLPTFTAVEMPGLSKIMDLAVYTPQTTIKSLIALQDYKLYFLNPETGKSSFILPIPDGSGFPRINAIFVDTFFFSDFDKLYTVDIPSAKVLTNASFAGATLATNFQFHV